VGFLLPRTLSTSGAPSPRALPFGRSCGTGVATLPSVPSSGFLPLSTVPASTRLARGLLDPAVRRGPRRFAAFFHAARVPGASLQSFPFPGSRTRSRGPFLPCGFAFDCRRRRARGTFTTAFPVLRASSLPWSNPPEGGPGTHEPGRRFLAVASPVASTRLSAPHVPSPSHVLWARRLAAGTPASKLYSPRESVPRRPRPWPGRGRPPVLSWDSHPPELSPPRFWVRPLAKKHAGDSRSRCHVPLRASSRRGCIPRPGLRRLGSRTQDPPIRAVDRTHVSPSSGDPAHRAPLERPVRQPPAPPAPFRTFWTERLARAPFRRHPAPPCPSRPCPPKGPGSLDLEDAHLEPSTSSHTSRREVAVALLAGRDLTARFRIGRSVADSRQPRRSGLPSRGSGQWWAPLLPGGPTLLGFRSSSNRLEGASFRAARGLFALRTGVLRALRLGRDAPSPGRLRSLLTPSFRSPELPVLSHGEVPLDSLRFGY